MDLASFIMCVVAVFLIVGFFYNIVKLFTYGESGLSKAIRLIGIFVPLIGSVYGWFGSKQVRLNP